MPMLVHREHVEVPGELRQHADVCLPGGLLSVDQEQGRTVIGTFSIIQDRAVRQLRLLLCEAGGNQFPFLSTVVVHVVPEPGTGSSSKEDEYGPGDQQSGHHWSSSSEVADRMALAK